MLKITKKISDGMVMCLPSTVKLTVERGEVVVTATNQKAATKLFCFKVCDERPTGYRPIGLSRFGGKKSIRVWVMMVDESELAILNICNSKFFAWFNGEIIQGFGTKKAGNENSGYGVAIIDRDAALNLIFQRMV